MRRLRSLLTMEMVPRNTDLGLLILRLFIGGLVVHLHGWGKIAYLSAEDVQFADPFGLGARVSLGMAMGAEVVGALMVLLGLAARWGALTLVVSMTTAFIVAHGAKLQGPGNGELAFAYMVAFLAILFAGAGRYSVDHLLSSGKRA